MKQRTNKIGLIGFGFLLEYLYPCYSRGFDSEGMKEHVKAVTADAQNIQKKQEKYPFEIILNDNQKMLKSLTPNMILFAPPPSVAEEIIRGDLKEYIEYCRDNQISLPRIFAFPPSPKVDVYLDILGEDVQVCNVLPNMMNEINGKSLQGREGNTYLSFSETVPCKQESKDIAIDFFSFIGNVVEVVPSQVLDMLGTLATHENISLLVYDMYKGLQKKYHELTTRSLASAFRVCHQQNNSYNFKTSTLGSVTCLHVEDMRIISDIMQAWQAGATQYLLDSGMDKTVADNIAIATLDINLHACQEQTEAFTRDKLKHHATKGGVAERGTMCYDLIMSHRIQGLDWDGMESHWEKTLCRWIKTSVYEISKIVGIHGRRLGGEAYGNEFSASTHAMLYAIMVREVRTKYEDDWKEIVEAITTRYAKQRGERMAQRTCACGDDTTMLNYHVYGEWKVGAEELKSQVHEKTPTYKVRVLKCPWYTTWERFGYLEEGKEYCRIIDKVLVNSYNKNLHLGVNAIHTLGDLYCEFDWNQIEMTKEIEEELKKKQERVQDSMIKDWLYHTSHLYHAIEYQLRNIQGGIDTLNQVIENLEVLFGAYIAHEVVAASEQDFEKI